MKRTLTIVGLALASLVLLGGCMTNFGSASGKLAYAEIEGESAGQVSIEEGFLFIIHPDVLVLGGGKGWENIDDDLDPVLAELDANAVRNMELSYGATLIDMVLSSVVPVVNWGTYTIQGEAVRQ
jgi:hypothetical protein